ncbi:hypothetical protein TNCV_1849841 [Trichonephila clavipes]|nr:hypothetical protein TNCV_1849841 [Trichonephila clavipes]
MLGRRIAARPRSPATVRHLQIALLEEWNSIPQRVLNKSGSEITPRQELTVVFGLTISALDLQPYVSGNSEYTYHQPNERSGVNLNPVYSEAWAKGNVKDIPRKPFSSLRDAAYGKPTVLIVRVQYFVRGGSVGHRSRASSKHLSPHLPVDELDSSGANRGGAAPADARVGVGSTKKAD